jgi:hypothetical protein
MNRSKLLLSVLFVLLLFSACIYRRAIPGFSQEAVVKDSLFFSRIPEIAKEKGILLDKNATLQGEMKFYRITFHERQVENGNVIDYSNVSNDSLQIPYAMSSGTYQELYLVNLPMSNETDNLYVYYTLNYNDDGKVVGFGPAYLGQLVRSPNNAKLMQLEFFVALESKRKAPFVLESTKDNTDLKFIVGTYIADSCITVNKIVEAMPNKIGGTRPLVFDTDSILGRNRLNFQYINK